MKYTVLLQELASLKRYYDALPRVDSDTLRGEWRARLPANHFSQRQIAKLLQSLPGFIDAINHYCPHQPDNHQVYLLLMALTQPGYIIPAIPVLKQTNDLLNALDGLHHKSWFCSSTPEFQRFCVTHITKSRKDSSLFIRALDCANSRVGRLSEDLVITLFEQPNRLFFSGVAPQQQADNIQIAVTNAMAILNIRGISSASMFPIVGSDRVLSRMPLQASVTGFNFERP